MCCGCAVAHRPLCAAPAGTEPRRVPGLSRDGSTSARLHCGCAGPQRRGAAVPHVLAGGQACAIHARKRFICATSEMSASSPGNCAPRSSRSARQLSASALRAVLLTIRPVDANSCMGPKPRPHPSARDLACANPNSSNESSRLRSQPRAGSPACCTTPPPGIFISSQTSSPGVLPQTSKRQLRKKQAFLLQAGCHSISRLVRECVHHPACRGPGGAAAQGAGTAATPAVSAPWAAAAPGDQRRAGAGARGAPGRRPGSRTGGRRSPPRWVTARPR